MVIVEKAWPRVGSVLVLVVAQCSRLLILPARTAIGGVDFG
jgi:hypothetical protein